MSKSKLNMSISRSLGSKGVCLGLIIAFICSLLPALCFHAHAEDVSGSELLLEAKRLEPVVALHESDKQECRTLASESLFARRMQSIGKRLVTAAKQRAKNQSFELSQIWTKLTESIVTNTVHNMVRLLQFESNVHFSSLRGSFLVQLTSVRLRC